MSNQADINKAIQKYLEGEQPASLMAAAGLFVKHLDFTSIINGGLDRGQITKIFNNLAIKSAELNATDGWEDQQGTLQGLISAKWLEKLIIKGCDKEITFLPTNLQTLEVHLTGDINALGWIVTNENLRNVKQHGGVISSCFWIYVIQRATKLRHLELDNVDLWMNSTRDMTEAMARIEYVTFNRIKLNGKSMDKEEIVGIINRRIEYIE